MRQIVLDTETTGLDPKQGHRIIEVGCVEMINRRITGNTYHCYINPERLVEREAQEVHGITDEFLKDKPKFSEMVEDFIHFVRDAELIIHNADFDTGFINHEFKLAKIKPAKITDYCQVYDTLKLARQIHPGQRNSLDALCKRYHVDNKHREWHGALLDSELLCQVYLMMTGGQDSLFADETENVSTVKKQQHVVYEALQLAATPVIYADQQELIAHENFSKKYNLRRDNNESI